MAENVFGTPITNSTLKMRKGFEENSQTITRKDRAKAALNLMNDEEKNKKAIEYIEKLRGKYGKIGVSTFGMIYNATGEPMILVNNHDWYGKVGASHFPERIENGQWGCFLHLKPTLTPYGSHGAVVYRGKNHSGSSCDWMVAWSNPWNRLSWKNKVYTEIREAGQYDNKEHWDYISSLLYKSNLYKTDKWKGCLSTVSTGISSKVIFEALFTLEDADN